MADRNGVGLLAVAERDLRLDLMRGIGQWMVFLDHIPYDIVSWLTLRNYGFSDAAEFFVFISGYTAGFVYGPAMAYGQYFAATKRLLWDGLGARVEDRLADEARIVSELSGNNDAREGLAAVIERRKPTFRGL